MKKLAFLKNEPTLPLKASAISGFFLDIRKRRSEIDAINKETKKTFEAFLIFIFIPLAFLVIMAQGRYKKSKFCILLFTRNKKDKGKDYCQSYKDKKP